MARRSGRQRGVIMESLLEFFYNLLITVWGNIDNIVTPILNVLSLIGTTLINTLTYVFTWLLSAVNVIIDLFNKICEFFGLYQFYEGVGGGHGGGGFTPRSLIEFARSISFYANSIRLYF